LPFHFLISACPEFIKGSDFLFKIELPPVFLLQN